MAMNGPGRNGGKPASSPVAGPGRMPGESCAGPRDGEPGLEADAAGADAASGPARSPVASAGAVRAPAERVARPRNQAAVNHALVEREARRALASLRAAKLRSDGTAIGLATARFEQAKGALAQGKRRCRPRRPAAGGGG